MMETETGREKERGEKIQPAKTSYKVSVWTPQVDNQSGITASKDIRVKVRVYIGAFKGTFVRFKI